MENLHVMKLFKSAFREVFFHCVVRPAEGESSQVQLLKYNLDALHSHLHSSHWSSSQTVYTVRLQSTITCVQHLQ